jgi:4-oxalocrotonate tautomerase
MPIVKVEWLEGRSKQEKAKVAKVIEEAMIEHGGCAPGVTYIVFEDVKKENWAIGGELKG